MYTVYDHKQTSSSLGPWVRLVEGPMEQAFLVGEGTFMGVKKRWVKKRTQATMKPRVHHQF